MEIMTDKFQKALFIIVACGIWGLATVFGLGLPIYIIDEIFGTKTLSLIDNYILNGDNGNLKLFKLWLCGIPLTILWLIDKKWKV
jgi:hypothetical protein